MLIGGGSGSGDGGSGHGSGMAPYRSQYKNAMNSLANTLNKEELLEK